ncbi:PliI family lysozyme inhibitor of I-type lysozyme [Herminiimonas aquatilis]|uniref:PliI family lysozyme inhibitor of I-type lysozyme n=1 Tax=Herminiimonas aquatilis TaxID=345342 RepID=A0ABW2J236_9BURK
MHKITLLLCSLLIAGTTVTSEAADKHRTISATMPQGMTVVAEEGMLEPRSAGSYSLQLYAKNDPAYPYDRFITGLVRPRNGALTEIRFADLTNDGKAEIIVITRYTGSGAFVTVDAFSIRNNSVRLLTSIAGMDAKKDPIKALKSKLHRGR